MAYLQFGCSLCNFSLPSMGDHLINHAAKLFRLHATVKRDRPGFRVKPLPCERETCVWCSHSHRSKLPADKVQTSQDGRQKFCRAALLPLSFFYCENLAVLSLTMRL